MDDKALQALAQVLSDNMGNKITLALANGIFGAVTAAMPKSEPDQKPVEPTHPA
jgi:hypothetical protein